MKARLGAPEAIPAQNKNEQCGDEQPAEDDSDPFGGAHWRVYLRGSTNASTLSARGVRRGPSMVDDG